MTDDEIMHVVGYSTVGSNAIAPTEWCAFARALLAASTSANVAREPDVFEWLETELSAISCRYHGDPSYDHDAYWMRDRVMKLIDEARKIFAFASVAQGAEAVEAQEIRQYVLSVLPSVYYMDPPDGGSVSVLEQLRRMADDAAKYRASTAQTAITGCVLTYRNQPDNVGAWQLGEACRRAAELPAGDYIDRGLGMLKELQAKGYGVIALTAAQSGEPK